MGVPRISIRKCSYQEIQSLRKLYLQEQNCQIRYDSCHWRGWADHYALSQEEKLIGYGAVKGLEELSDRDTIFEVYILPPFRGLSSNCLSVLLDSSGARYMEAQTNDLQTTQLLCQDCEHIRSDVILFEDAMQTDFPDQGTTFRKRRPTDLVFGKQSDKDEYVLLLNDQVVAAGGFLLHYNEPFADLYMEVDPEHRRKGYAALILQEIKKACYLAGRIPAARCNISNPGSKASLLKAGFKIVGCMVTGEIKSNHGVN
ncbi:MAG: GNAT family N-acetyltransferase [Cytophagales bacterium]|nr:GNAT family N-acetyltransferase [Cytophagales bacterium]